jgi:pyruvate/2-oxoglutarate dehydrogenase complex dihydrolipoamide dehydrogenase (E3) component
VEKDQRQKAGSSGMKTLKADLAIIGAGSGGLSAASGAAQLGLRVVLFEKHEMGGDCLNFGCVPSKALLSAAKYAQSAREARKFGVEVCAPQTHWEDVKAHVRGVIEHIAPVDSQERFEGLGVTVIREAAHFHDARTIVSETARVTARRIIIATGSRAFVPPIPGLDTLPYLTNETIFSVSDFPEKLIVLGGGPIGLELSQAFQRLGSEVTVVEMGRALARSDEAQARIAIDAVKAEGVTLLEGYKAVRVSGSAGAIVLDTEAADGPRRIEGTHILVATGRRAVLDGLDLEKGNVQFDKKGIVVKDTLRSVSNPRVWALGDAAGREQFTHTAGWHASVFVRRAFFKQATKADSQAMPFVTYTAPEVAQLGLTEAEARAKHGHAVTVSRFPFHENDRAIAEGKMLGEVKLIHLKGKALIGASIVGEGAGDLIQLVSVAIAGGLSLRALTDHISPYPTRAEAVKRAASAHFTSALFSPAARSLVGLLQRIP